MSCETARLRQLLMRRPFASTVHAPHWPWSQPFLVPVRWRCSRSASSSVVRGSRSIWRTRPLTVRAVVIAALRLFYWRREKTRGRESTERVLCHPFDFGPASSLDRRRRLEGMTDFSLRPIGVIRSVLRSLDDAPKQGREGAPDAWLEIDPAFARALLGVAKDDDLVVITWLHRADREVL